MKPITTTGAEMQALANTLTRPGLGSHKGQNGKVLVIGGSELFHSSLVWAAQAASLVVDMVHVASPAAVNERLVRERIKSKFLEGIVIAWNFVNHYVEEDDAILIGPGMPREEGLEGGETATSIIVNDLLQRYPSKRWVIDGGALQEVEPDLISGNVMITPHLREWESLYARTYGEMPASASVEALTRFSVDHGNATILLTGEVDMVVAGKKAIAIEGGSVGMTKGGTGDVLAGLVTGLFSVNEAYEAAVVGSGVNKRAGELLEKTVGRFFTATDLVEILPQSLHEIVKK